jgi:hypothetical protein
MRKFDGVLEVAYLDDVLGIESSVGMGLSLYMLLTSSAFAKRCWEVTVVTLLLYLLLYFTHVPDCLNSLSCPLHAFDCLPSTRTPGPMVDPSTHDMVPEK